VAKSDCELYVLSRAEFNQRSRANPVLGVLVFARIAKAMSQRLRQTDAELRAIEDR
jgi:CRP-like cAMP-binding protein